MQIIIINYYKYLSSFIFASSDNNIMNKLIYHRINNVEKYNLFFLVFIEKMIMVNLSIAELVLKENSDQYKQFLTNAVIKQYGLGQYLNTKI